MTDTARAQSTRANIHRPQPRWAEPFDLNRHFGPQRTTLELPDPRNQARNLAFCSLEILAGVREVEQLARWVNDEVYRNLRQRAHLAAEKRRKSGKRATRPRLRILGDHLSSPTEGIVEAAVVIDTPTRVRSVALRLESLDRRWRATSLALL